VVCGGGLGVRPSSRRHAYHESGAYVIGVLGFRSKSLIFWEDKFGACCNELIVCRRRLGGTQGLVTEASGERSPPSDIEEVVAIGPRS
jgi:hypothetical protein